MFAHIRRNQIFVALPAGAAVAILASYFSAGTRLSPPPLKNQPEATESASISPAVKLENARETRAFQGSADADDDGLPDAAELSTFMDRENFRRWFTSIAEVQFYRPSEHWNADQRDCSGLVRFAWREALRRHDRIWFKRMGAGYEQVAPDVTGYTLELGPLGEKLFRTDFGSYRESDLATGKFSEFADARALKTFNSRFVSRDRQKAEPGDLLFFHQPWVQKFPFHVMVYLGRASIADEGNRDWVVYHTGSSVVDQGTVKLVRLSVLDQHPNKRWRPVQSNRNFLGFYRLKILE